MLHWHSKMASNMPQTNIPIMTFNMRWKEYTDIILHAFENV